MLPKFSNVECTKLGSSFCRSWNEGGQGSEKTPVKCGIRELIHAHWALSIVSLPTEPWCFSDFKRFLSYIIIVNLRQEEWIRNPPSYYCSEPITLLIGPHYIVKDRLNYFFNSTWLIINGWFQNTLSTFSLTQTHYGEKSLDDFKTVAWLRRPPWGLLDESPFSQV